MDFLPSIFTKLSEYSTTLGEQPAAIGDDDRLSFQRLNFLVDQLVADFRHKGVVEGVVVGLRFRDPLKHLVVSLALFKGGVTQVSIPPRESEQAQKKIVDATAVRMVISDVSEPVIEGVQHAEMDAEWHLLCEEISDATLGNCTQSQKVIGPALIFMGSGTTGHPKVMAVDFALLAHLVERDLAVRDFHCGERHYCESSLDYYTAKRRTLGCLAAGVAVMLPKSPAKRLVSYCLEHGVHHVSLTVSQANAMLVREREFSTPDFPRLPALRSIFIGSSPASENARERIRREISGQLFVVYGSNEFGEATVATPDDQDKHPGTVGRACPGVLLEIVDDFGMPCAIGENGRIRLRSSPMMQGYVGDLSGSNRNFREGWYYPGDIGSLSEDGNLVFRGRSDDMMICRGVNIYPREIEMVLESHPAVTEAAAFPLRTGMLEDLPFAVVCAENVSEVELMKHCQAYLGWRRPLRIFFTATMPRNPAGKILKRVLVETVAEQLNARKI